MLNVLSREHLGDEELGLSRRDEARVVELLRREYLAGILLGRGQEGQAQPQDQHIRFVSLPSDSHKSSAGKFASQRTAAVTNESPWKGRAQGQTGAGTNERGSVRKALGKIGIGAKSKE